MALQKPESMDECVYFTSRSLLNEASEPKGEITAWVFRGDCPECKKAKMGKPRGSDGKVKMRSKEYVCPACAHSMEKDNYENSLTAYAEYTCPKCNAVGEAETSFKRQNLDGVKTLRFQCAKCSANLDVTKKMKEKKLKKSKDF